MNRRKFESCVALAMLPIGAFVTLGSLIGAAAVLAYAADAVWRWPADAAWRIGWSITAAIAAAFNVRKGIETMATVDWHVAVAPLAVALAIAVTCPAWWP